MSAKTTGRKSAKGVTSHLKRAIEVGAYTAKKEFSRILREARAGKRFIITRRGKAVAEIGPPGPATGRRQSCWGDMQGMIRMADDFFAPLPELEKYFE
jgi:antitoxin (DNA-binding transcriptional repressor) of toxin-antitoxin stability system